MKTIISLIATSALFAGIGTQEAKAENFFHRIGRQVRNAHERHVEMFEEAHDRHVRILTGGDRDGRPEPRACGHYEVRCEQIWVDGCYVTRMVEVKDPGHFECREVVQEVPGYYRNVWVAPVYRFETDHCGHTIRIEVSCGHYQKVWVAPTCVKKEVKVWVEGGCHQEAQQVWIEGHYDSREVRVWVND